jgi:flap endonuclease-1
MGIKGIKKLIKKHVPEAISPISIHALKGKTICIDSSILLYKFRYTYEGDNFHILGFLHKTIDFLEKGIKPIYVFDGKPPEEKRQILNKRKEQLDKINELLDRIDERILIETAFNDPDKTVALLTEARHLLVDIANNWNYPVTDWQKVADTIFLDKDIS